MSTILIVDDEPRILLLLQSLLKTNGYAVQTAQDGVTALDLVRKGGIDITVTDLRMSPVDGMQLFREIQKVAPQMPVILLTAYASVETAIDAMKSGVYDYLTKPFSTRELVARVSALLRRTTVEPEASNINPDDLEFDFCGGTVIPLDRIFVNERNKVIRLSRSEIKLMRLFAQNVNRTLRKEMLLKTVWSGYTVQSRAIDTHITSIRRKVGRYGRNILSVYGVGYKFLGF